MKPLELETRYEPCRYGTDAIVVGNSGLVLYEQATSPEVWDLHFTPEGNYDGVGGKERQYALTFLGAVLSLGDFLTEAENVPTPQQIHMRTNKRMADFMVKNLGPVAEVVDNRGLEVELSLHLDEVGKDEEVWRNLYQAQQRVLSAHFEVDDPGIV